MPAFYYSDPTDHLHLPPEVPIVWEAANGLIPLDPEDGVKGAKVRFRWYIPADNEISGGAVLNYDIWWSTLATAATAPGPSLIGGPATREVFVGDEGLIEFDYPADPFPLGFDCFNAHCSISGVIHAPGGAAFNGWYQTSVFTGTPDDTAPPPDPYKDPALSAVNAAWAAVRFKTRQ